MGYSKACRDYLTVDAFNFNFKPHEALAMMGHLKQTACISASEHLDYNDSAS